MRRLVVLASILVDVIVWVDAWPERGGDALARRGKATPGGAFNTIAAARRLGTETAYAGIVGRGPFGDIVKKELAALGVPILVEGPEARDDTGFDIAVVEKDGERTFVTSPGAEAKIDRDHLARVDLRQDDAVVISGYDLAYPVSGPALAAWAAGLPEGTFLFLDPGPLVAEIPPARLGLVLGRVDMLALNRREAGLLTGAETTADACARVVSRLKPAATAILRDGPQGAIIATRDALPVVVPAKPATPVDTTGAGDVHGAVLLSRLASGRTMREAVREANAAASFAVEHEGPSASPTAPELDALLADW